MPTHIAWPSIALLHNVVLTLGHLHEVDGKPFPKITYRAKMKLHGTNTGVQVIADGVFAQSRTQVLTTQSDYKGYAAWVHAHESAFARLPTGTTVFGEWCGPGVEKGMAISQLDAKIFAVFALQVGAGEEATLVVDPDTIRARLPDIPGLHVIPWEGPEVVLDYASKESLDAAAMTVNTIVHAVEAEDPWVKRAFGKSGVGEGLVFYAVGDNIPARPSEYALLMWKAKGDKHRTAGSRVPVQIDPQVADSVDDFVALMVTDARLRQGISEACGGEVSLRNMSGFLAWVAGDVAKESAAELHASGLVFAQVEKAVIARARAWLKAQASPS